jgi:hypothetical protein
MKHSSETIARWITAVKEESRNLTKWEEDFITSLDYQMEGYGRISDRQEEILERIYAEKTS